MKKKPSRQPAQTRLGHRERQILDAVYHLNEASVADVLDTLDDPPSYSAVRKMMNVLVDKGVLSYRREGTRFIYKPTQPASTARRTAARKLLDIFCSSSPTEAVNAILDISTRQLTDEDFEQLQSMIERAKQKGK